MDTSATVPRKQFVTTSTACGQLRTTSFTLGITASVMSGAHTAHAATVNGRLVKCRSATTWSTYLIGNEYQ
jgi:hypothetical protein